tara:strand:- start:13 stop:933 length:921 start_codon:yes stop_codon:yes gene_type:complete
MLPVLQERLAEKTNLSKAALLLLGSLLLYTIQDVLIKSLPSKYSVFEIIFFRSLFSLIPIFFLGFMEQGHFKSPLPLLKTQYLKGQVIRAFLMFVSLIFYIMACRSLPLASLYTLTYTTPLFMTMLAIPFLGERVGIYRSLAVIIGFVGVFVTLQPGNEMVQLNGLYAVASGFFTAIAVVIGKRLCAHDSNTLLAFMYTMAGLLGSFIMLPFVWVTPDLGALFLLLAIGTLGGIAQFGFVHAFRVAPISSLAPFDYCGLVWAALAGYILWQDIPSSYTITGAFLIVSMGLLTLYREKKRDYPATAM